ncbi:AAA family ATPase [Streptomyces shenzhenensis]
MNHTIDTTAPANDHYLGLAGARLLPTTASRLTQRHLATVIKARALFCVHGDVGLGKTFAINTSLRDLAPDNTLWLECRKGAPLGTLRAALYRALALHGEPPAKGDAFDQLLVQAFAEQHRVLVCDEAQGLTRSSLEYLQTLWENRRTQLTVILAGGDNCLQRIRSCSGLFSRIPIYQQYQPLTPDEVLALMPTYHALWQNVAPDDLMWINDAACHGNFRNWAKVTFHIQDILEQHPETAWFSRDTVRMVLSFLDSSIRS